MCPSDDANNRLRYPGFSEALSFRPEADVLVTVETNTETQTLSFHDDLYQGDISNSVSDDTKNILSQNLSRQPSRALSSRMSPLEAVNDERLKLHQNINSNFEQPEARSEGMKMSSVWQVSSAEEALPPETKPEELQTKITELEGLVKLLSKLEQEQRMARQEQEKLVFHWKKQHTEVCQTVQDLEGYIRTLEKEVRRTMEMGEAQARSHSAMIHKLNYDHKGEIFQHRRQALTILEERIEYHEKRYKQHLREAEETDRTVTHLTQALETGQKALVKHLQEELEIMVNPMPIDHGSSTMIEDEEAGESVEQHSREISQYYDDGRDRIITKLHGSGGRENLGEAIEEKEISLTRVAGEAGLDQLVDKASATVFGIRRMSTEYTSPKRLSIEREGGITEPRQVNEEMVRRGERHTNHPNEILETHNGDKEQRAHSIEGEIFGLRRQFTEEAEHIGVVETEILSLRERMAELEETSAVLEKSKDDLETRIKGITHWERKIRLLKSNLTDLKATTNEKISGALEVDSLRLRSLREKLRFANDQHQTSTPTLNHLLQTVFTTKLAISKLTKERESLKNDLSQAAEKSQASSIRLAHIFHDLGEKETEWDALRQAKASQPRQNRVVEDLLSEISDVKILSQVGGDKAAMLGEVHERSGRTQRAEVQKITK